MKKYFKIMKKYLYIAAFVVLFTACNSEEPSFNTISVASTRTEHGMYEECTNLVPPVDAYIYPAYPGTDAWAEFHSHYESMDEIIQALLPSNELAKQLSTESLIHAYIDFPFSVGFTQFQKDIIDYQFMEYSICRELKQREDTPSVLIEMYERLQLKGCVQGTAVHTALLRIIAVPEIANKMNEQQTKTFVGMVLAKLKVCKDSYDTNTYLTNKLYSAFILGRIMKSANFAPLIDAMKVDSNMTTFVNIWNNPMEIESESVDNIINFAEQFISDEL